ncbi:3-deoxy-D-manno-octulosonic-acid transferase [Galdieria sulphuraria]|uniref:3-deoxy-D-manno-octulosonic-acid transferase n=1 Tax=Galdieria sulphuraria TaxID=130081 RepID=M2X803_GALSU|nr:3-deoxy-D-manno-octulosonic-acid transferase [Galdieria sulphuraria]EME32685.1 3-deoxy-D-manno-octulosonic-acid transferase [Galdieria sulphuraria]|eukprot:XP_005709205.1 3-deoxy-D-manno-octulosonic-acid transferase [Galdieria sulphuraria]
MSYKGGPSTLFGNAANFVAPLFALVESAYYKFFRRLSWRDSVEVLTQRLSLTSEVELKETCRSPVSLWFHGASLGETRTALAFCAAVLRALDRKNAVLFPYENNFQIRSLLFTSANVAAQEPLLRGLDFLNKTSLKTGTSAEFQRRLVPYDCPSCVNRFLSRFLPRNAIFIESELWPTLLQESKKKGVKLFLLDGRLSPASKERWTSSAFGTSMLKQMLTSFHFIGARNEEEAFFFKQFGCSNVKVIPPLKVLLPSGSEGDSVSLPTRFGPSWMVCRTVHKIASLKSLPKGISTHDPEEISLLRVHKRLCTTWKLERKPLLILAPRHVERTSKIFRAAQFIGFKPSEIAVHSRHSLSDNVSLLIIDSYGVLSSFFQQCKVVFVGNSLVPPGGGHNIAEPLHYKCVVLHGSYIKNFVETWRYLNIFNSSSPVTCMIQNEDNLFNRIQYFLLHLEKAHEWGEMGYTSVKEAEEFVVSSVLHELVFEPSTAIS